MKFHARQFAPTKWETADEKAWFANHFMRFVESGFDQRHFTERFYRRLSNTFGHIAHYNRLGFWETFFTTNAGQLLFLEMSLVYPCYGDPSWTYSDVERAIRTWLRESGIVAKYSTL